MSPNPHGEAASFPEMARTLVKLRKINAALMSRVERSMDHQANAFSLFQAAIGLEEQVRGRTEELNIALSRLERVNDELVGARDAAERANSFKTRFFTALGHDLLQPLHAARLTLSAVEGEETPFEQRRLAAQIDHALSTIEELLKTILDLSRLEAGVMKPTRQAVSLAHLFRTLALDMEPLAGNKGLALRWRDTPAVVTSDPLMLRRILQNLLANSVQYTETGSILLAARPRGDVVRIEVWDTGPGIPPAERDRIFEEFQRGSAAEKSAVAGCGLGLSIVRRTADALCHGIAVCSRVGRGTCFSVTAPLRNELDPRLSDGAGPAVRPQSGFDATNVLVLDNDAAVLEAMRTLLERWNCRAQLAADLKQADAIMDGRVFQPDIILADYHLNRRECGLSAVERLRAGWGVKIPAIVITADYAPATAAEARNAGCEILYKPVKPAELRALMLHLLSVART